MTTRDEQIRLIAYEIWEEEGRPHGKHVEHWIQAERRWSQAHRADGDGKSPVGASMAAGSAAGSRSAGAGAGTATATRPAAPAPPQVTAVRAAPRPATNGPDADKRREQTRSPRTRRPEK